MDERHLIANDGMFPLEIILRKYQFQLAGLLLSVQFEWAIVCVQYLTLYISIHALPVTARRVERHISGAGS